MTDIRSKTRELYALEQLADGATILHRLHPMAKLLGCIGYLVCLISLRSGSLGQMAAFCFYPVIVLALGEVPFGMVFRRCLIVLPFCLLMSLGNLLTQREVLMMLGPIPVTEGLISSLGILVRAILSVAAVLALIAVTPFPQLTGALGRLHVPGTMIALLEMTYRYVGVLMDEAGHMSDAYHLRAPNRKGLEMRHMGSFVGSLLLRSFDRAERIYGAMRCRGYGGQWHAGRGAPMDTRDVCYLILVLGSSVLFRLTDLAGWLGGVLSYWM